MPARARFFPLLFLMTSAACGGPVQAPAPAQAAGSSPCAALAGAYAAWVKVCNGIPLPASRIAAMVARCEAREALPGLDVSQAAIRGCADQVASSSCAALPIACLSPRTPWHPNGFLTSVWLGPAGMDTYELFPRAAGALARGAHCDLDAQCKSGACQGSLACGACVEEKKLGEACGPLQVCGAREQCTGGVCKDVGRPLGDRCTAVKGDSECREELFCRGDTCAPRLKPGEACTLWGCEAGAVCQDGACRALEEVHEGEACDESNHGALRCADEWLVCAEGHCRRQKAGVQEGGSCLPDVCAPGLTCAYGKCKRAQPAGGRCMSTNDCAPNLHCKASPAGERVCAGSSANGESCGGVGDCDDDTDCDMLAHRCVPQGGEGAACDPGPRCRAPLSCRDKKCSPLGVCSAR